MSAALSARQASAVSPPTSRLWPSSSPPFPSRSCGPIAPLRNSVARRIADLHLWQIGPGHRAAVVSIVSDRPQAPAAYKQRLADVPRLSHVTIEVQPCPG